MSVDARVEPLTGKVPAMTWRWDVETDILSGSFKGGGKTTGLTGTIELTDEEGSIAVLDVASGAIRGLDVVVWPEVTTVPDLAPPAPDQDGKVVVPARPSRPGIASLEVDTSLTMSTNPAESVFHLRIGARRSVRLIRVADHLLIEIDTKHRLAGFWLVGVPKFVPEDE